MRGDCPRTLHSPFTVEAFFLGCYSWIKQEFEANFDNIEHVSIMNDNWEIRRNRSIEVKMT